MVLVVLTDLICIQCGRPTERLFQVYFVPTRYQYKTPFVLATSPSLPATLVVAILIATANALNALSAL